MRDQSAVRLDADELERQARQVEEKNNRKTPLTRLRAFSIFSAVLGS
jgi:hypothetical protein